MFSVPPGSVPPDVEMLFEIEANAVGLARGPDELVVEAFWHALDGTEVDWDPVGVTAVTTRADGVTVRFAKRPRHPPGGTRLSVRCGLRWSPRGRVAWHLGHEAAQILNDLIDGGRNVGVNTETVISTRFVDGRVEPATRPAAATGTS